MYRFVRSIAFVFKALNFFLDLWQTWQFAGGGGVAAVIAFITTYFQDKPLWFAIVFSLCIGIFIVCIASLIFKSYAVRVTEDKRLRRLPRLVYDIHKRVCTVREKFVRHIDWEKIDTGKMLTPILNMFQTAQGIVVNDDRVSQIESELDEAGGMMHGTPSIFDAMMKKSDTSLVNVLERDFKYRLLMARLDGYKPYPSEVIRKDVEAVIDGSITFNNVIVFQNYASPESLSLEALSTFTQLSDIKKHQVNLANINTIDIMNTMIEKASTRLREHVGEYLDKRGQM